MLFCVDIIRLSWFPLVREVSGRRVFSDLNQEIHFAKINITADFSNGLETLLVVASISFSNHY